MQQSSLLPTVWEVPEIFRKRLGAKVGRQRAMQADGHLLLVLHEPPSHDDDERKGRFIWRKPDGEWTSSDLGGGAGVVGKHLDQFADNLQQCDELEDRAATAEEYFSLIETLSPIQRAARNLHTVLQDARQMFPDDRDIINFRDRAYDIARTAELLYSGSKNGLDFAIAKRAEEQAQASRQMSVASHRLNLLVAFFFPLATLSAIFGVNLQHGLEDSPAPFAFFGLLAVALFCGIVLTIFVTKR